MIGTIRRHQNWLWYFIIVVVIGSFVVYFSPNQRYGGGLGSHDSSGPDLGSINGEPITPQQLTAAEREAKLLFRLRSGTWPQGAEQEKQVRHVAEQDLVIDSLLKDYKITATTDAASRFTKQMFGVPQGQALPLEKLNEWVQTELMAKGGLNMDDLDHYVRHQTGQAYLMSLFGMSGELITSKEAEFFYRRENQPMSTEIVSFPVTNYYSSTPPAETNLQDYFTKHQAEYRLPDRVIVNYIAFDASNYQAKADQLLGTNMDDKIAEYYRQQGPEFFKDESGQPLDEAAAKAKLKKQTRQNAELSEARKDANAFLSGLLEGHDDAHPFSPSDLEKLAKTNKLTVKSTGPFDERTGTKDLDLPPKAVHVLFAMRDYAPGDPEATNDPERSLLYVQSPMIGETAVYVIGLNKRIPSELQPLEAVREKVIKDYREFTAITKSKEAGESFATAAQVGMMQGKSFEAVCAAQNVKPQALPPFALTTTNMPLDFDRSDFQQLEETVFPLVTGQSSKYVAITDGGFVAYLKDRLPVDEARMVQELPAYLARMRQQRQVAAFSEWLNRQIQLRLILPPGEMGGAG